ncbi:MAG: SLC13 family permease [Clostridia bacterium]|nr:SLC13 family permease [Clostridia bacterium]
MDNKIKVLLNILIGIILAAAVSLVLPGSFPMQAKIALGVVALMVYWWITRPVHLAVTALVPIIVNSFHEMIPMKEMMVDYANPIVLLILGAGILTAAWTLHGLDKRVALGALSAIGPSVRKQIAIWFVISVVMSAFMPNMVVVAALCPIAASMAAYSEGDSKQPLYLLLLAIAWGAGIGGFGTPMGGAMNLVAISNIEGYTGTEFFYGEWVIAVLPYLLVVSAVTLAFVIFIKRDKSIFNRSKEFYKLELQKLGRISKAEVASLVLLTMAVALAFARPFYEKILPGFKPPYVFLLLGVLTFFLRAGGKRVMDWKHAAKNINWGLMILFAGGLAIGGLIVDTGAAASIAGLVTGRGGLFAMVLVIVGIGMFLANASSNTAACAVLIPIVITVASGSGADPLPYVFLAVAACNSAYMLPTSIRAVPVGYGLDPGFMFKKGIGAWAVVYAALCLFGYIIVS